MIIVFCPFQESITLLLSANKIISIKKEKEIDWILTSVLCLIYELQLHHWLLNWTIEVGEMLNARSRRVCFPYRPVCLSVCLVYTWHTIFNLIEFCSISFLFSFTLVQFLETNFQFYLCVFEKWLRTTLYQTYKHIYLSFLLLLLLLFILIFKVVKFLTQFSISPLSTPTNLFLFLTHFYRNKIANEISLRALVFLFYSISNIFKFSLGLFF